MRPRDEIEIQYERAIADAIQRGESDRAQELAVGLSQYQRIYKPGAEVKS